VPWRDARQYFGELTAGDGVGGRLLGLVQPIPGADARVAAAHQRGDVGAALPARRRALAGGRVEDAHHVAREGGIQLLAHRPDDCIAQWEHAENDEFKQARKPTPKCRHTHKLARATNMQSLVRDDMHSHNEPHMNMLFIARVRAFALSQETARESRVLMTMRSTSVVC